MHLSQTHQRIISTIAIVCILLAIANSTIIALIVLAILLGLAAYEASNLIKLNKQASIAVGLALGTVGSLPFAIHLKWLDSFDSLWVLISAVLLLCLLGTTGAHHALGKFLKALQMSLMGIWIAATGFCALNLYWLPESIFNIVFVIVVVAASDIGAWAIGRTFKGPKLLASISPNKTWSGALGGFTIAALIGTILGIFTFHEMLWTSLWVAGTTAIVSQIGDLAISFLKRKANVKDTGRLIPGHGGLLDRIDGHLLALPYIFWVSLWL